MLQRTDGIDASAGQQSLTSEATIAKDQREPTLDEILASIRRIVSEDEPVSQAKSSAREAAKSSAAPPGAVVPRPRAKDVLKGLVYGFAAIAIAAPFVILAVALFAPRPVKADPASDLLKTPLHTFSVVITPPLGEPNPSTFGPNKPAIANDLRDIPGCALNPDCAAGERLEEANDIPSAIASYTTALQKSRRGSKEDTQLRERIIDLALKLNPKPTVPAEARQHGIGAEALAKAAQTDADREHAAAEYRIALKLAPWWADAYLNYGLLEEAMHKPAQAAWAYTFYLRAAPEAPDRESVQDRIYAQDALANKAAQTQPAGKASVSSPPEAHSSRAGSGANDLYLDCAKSGTHVPVRVEFIEGMSAQDVVKGGYNAVANVKYPPTSEMPIWKMTVSTANAGSATITWNVQSSSHSYEDDFELNRLTLRLSVTEVSKNAASQSAVVQCSPIGKVAWDDWGDP